jgi:hypothetical protein
MISGLRPALVSKAPVAQAVLPAADIPPRILSPFLGFGATTCSQPLPVLRAKGRWWPVLADPGRGGELLGGVINAWLFLVKVTSQSR